jgi:hypothetical protein
MTQDTGVNAIPRHDKSADRLRKTIKVTGPASYATGGESISLLNDLGMSDIHMIAGNIMRTTAGGANCRIVALNRETPTSPKLQWYDLAGAEIANGVDLSTFSGEIEFIGR